MPNLFNKIEKEMNSTLKVITTCWKDNSNTKIPIFPIAFKMHNYLVENISSSDWPKEANFSINSVKAIETVGCTCTYCMGEMWH